MKRRPSFFATFLEHGKHLVAVPLLVASLAMSCQADEGMLPISELERAKLGDRGLKLHPANFSHPANHR